MSVADIAVIGIVLVSGLVAFSMGFVRLVLALLGWIGAAFATLYLFTYAQPYAHQWISIGFLADAAAGLAIFIVTLTILTIVSHMIGGRIRSSNLSALDRSVGLLFGLGFGAVIVCLTYLSLIWAIDLPRDTDKQPTWIRDARTQPVVKWGSDKLRSLAPESWISGSGQGWTVPKDSRTSFERLVSPETKKPADSDREGYSKPQRREMDRLFRGQR
jgi:membrane protein required for colicin V production